MEDIRRPNLLVTTSTFHDGPQESTPRFIYDLCRAMRPHFRVTVLAPSHPHAAPVTFKDGLRIIRFRYAPFRRWEQLANPEVSGGIPGRIEGNPLWSALVPPFLVGQLIATRRLLSAERFDCVHCHWLVPSGWVQALLSYLPRATPYIVTAHGSDVALLNRTFLRPIGRLVANKSARIAAVTEKMRDELLTELRVRPASTDIPVIPMGIDTEKFHPSKRDEGWAEHHGLSRPVIIFAGRLVKLKGLSHLLEAMAGPLLSATPATLAVFGDGPLAQVHREQVRSLGLEARVRFFGARSHDDLAHAYASADILCLPSLREGEPSVLWEAAASGLPAVSTVDGRISDAADAGSEFFLRAELGNSAALAEACHRLVTNASLRKKLSTAARQAVDSRTWPKIAESYAKILTAAMATTGCPRQG